MYQRYRRGCAVAVPWLCHQGQENLSQAPSAASRAYGSRRVGSAAPNRIAKYGGAPRRGVRRSRSIPGQWVILSGEYLADIIIKHDYCIQFLSSACVYIYIYMYVLYIYIYIDFTSWNRNWSRHRNHQYPAVALVTRATLLCFGSITKWKKLDRDWLKGQEGKLSVIVDLYIYNI